MILATVTGLFAWIVFAAFAYVCLWAAWVARRSHVEERVRPERERPIDLAAERSAHLALRDRHEEDVALRRAA